MAKTSDSIRSAKENVVKKLIACHVVQCGKKRICGWRGKDILINGKVKCQGSFEITIVPRSQIEK